MRGFVGFVPDRGPYDMHPVILHVMCKSLLLLHPPILGPGRREERTYRNIMKFWAVKGVGEQAGYSACRKSEA